MQDTSGVGIPMKREETTYMNYTHCLGLGHETMVSAVYLSIFLYGIWQYKVLSIWKLFQSKIIWEEK